jgi:acetolactate synthase-1/2/3 large subunit
MDVLAELAPNKSCIRSARLEQKWTVADVVVEYLHVAGVTKIFGVPGGATIPFHNSVEKHGKIDFVLARHEGGAAFMADCYARVSGKLGVCVATTGPGATNLMTGVGAAYMDSIPLLVITGMNPTDSWGRGDFQECTPMAGVDTTRMFESMCKLSEVVVSERILKQRLRNAIATALSGRPGPVHLAIPRDLWGKHIAWEPFELEKHLSLRPAPLESRASEVADLLRSSRCPLILCGCGTSTEALSRLLEISKYQSIPLVTTPRGKGKGVHSVPDTFLGSMGISASPVADDLIKSCTFDVVLTVGAGFGSYATNTE